MEIEIKQEKKVVVKPYLIHCKHFKRGKVEIIIT